MQRLWIVLLLVPLLGLSGCQPGGRFGVSSDGDIGEHVEPVFPLAPGRYRPGAHDAPDADLMAFVVDRDADSYFVTEPRETEEPLRFKFFAASDLGAQAYANMFVVQLIYPGEYRYYFAIVSADVITVLTPARGSISLLGESHLKDIATAVDGTDILITDPADTLMVLQEIASGSFGLEVLLQLAPSAASSAR